MEIQGKVIAVLPHKGWGRQNFRQRVEEPGVCPRDGGKQTAEPVPAADERQHRPVCG